MKETRERYDSVDLFPLNFLYYETIKREVSRRLTYKVVGDMEDKELFVYYIGEARAKERK